MRTADAGIMARRGGSHERKRPVRLLAYSVVVVAACLVVLAPLVAIAPFDRPSADDFPYSTETRAIVESGGGLPQLVGAAAQTSADAYQTWQGLYTATFLFALQPGIFGSTWYQVGAYAMIACLLFSCLYLAYAAERYLFAARSRFWAPVGLLLATCILQCLPAINEAVYWYNGAANYTPWFCAAMVASGCCITALRCEGRLHAGVMVALASVLVFAAGGCNYMPSFVCVMAMFGFAVIGVRSRRFALVVPFVAAFAGLLLNAMAPGTAVRQAMFPDHPGVVSTIAHSVWQALMNVHSFADASLLVALLLATPYLALWVRACDMRFTRRGFAVTLGLSFVALVGANCVPFYGTGSFGIGRTYNTCFEVFAVSAFACWTCLLGLVVHGAASARSAIRSFAAQLDASAALSAAIAVVGVALVTFWGGLDIEGQHGNGFQAARELANGTAASYAQEYDEREGALLAAGDDDAVVIRPLETRSSVLFFSDVEGQYGDDWSTALASYYQVGEVVLEGSDGENEEAPL